MRKIIITCIGMLALSLGATAQNITVQSAVGQSPSAFIQNNLLGGGVYVFNAKYANSSSTISTPGLGTFQSNGFAGLMMANGILMTTGDISVAVGPNSQQGASTTGNSNYTDPEMNAVATQNVTGCSTLDFDFVSLSGSVQFNYSFASEEYPEYVCSNFNDVFAFFLTGPDPETGEEVTRNIAMIPGSDSVIDGGVAVAINSVNAGMYGGNGSLNGGGNCYYDYSNYYVNNCVIDSNGGNGFYGTSNDEDGIQYDGYTSKLTAEAQIVPCQVYHMHISVCNVSDNSYDSGVFLEGGSFTAPTTAIGLSRPGVTPLHGSCPYSVPLSLAETRFSEGTVHFALGGTAVEGVDFELLDENGQPFGSAGMTISDTPHSFILQGLPDADLSETKTIEVYLATSLCSSFPDLMTYDTMRFTLDRGGDVRVKDTTITCTHACFEVGTELEYGENVSYRWEPTTGLDNPYSLHTTASIFESTNYILIARGGSGCNTDTAHVSVVITEGNPDIPVGIDEAADGEVKVYPNPAGDVIYLDAKDVRRVEIFTVEGRKVFDRAYSATSGTIGIPTEGMANGTYGIRVSTAEGMYGSKIVVKK